MSTTIDDLVAATPDTRDRSVDFLRRVQHLGRGAVALGVLGHPLERARRAHDAEPDRARARALGPHLGVADHAALLLRRRLRQLHGVARERTQGWNVLHLPAHSSAAVAHTDRDLRRGVDGVRAARTFAVPGVRGCPALGLRRLRSVVVPRRVHGHCVADADHDAVARTRARARSAAWLRRSLPST